VRGHKSVDIRTWQVTYRGPLAVHAAAKRRAGRCRDLGFDPNALAHGAVIGTVILADIQPLDEAAYEALQPRHLMDTPFPGSPCYAWFLEDATRLPEPVPARGRMKLFEVKAISGQPSAVSSQPDDRSKQVGVSRSQARLQAERTATDDSADQRSNVPTFQRSTDNSHPSPPYRATPPPQPDPARPFALYTISETTGYRIALYQWVPTGSTAERHGGENEADHAAPAGDKAPGALWHVEIGGSPLHAVTDHLLAALRANGYKATDLAGSVGSETPFYLDESSGLRLALILMAVKPLHRQDRIEAIGHSIQAMSDEEAYYWFSKCSAGDDASRAQRALRVLLAEE